jgi:MraZ protein
VVIPPTVKQGGGDPAMREGQGEATNRLDAKGRLAIPPGMRMELLGQDGRSPVVTRLLDAPALGLYPAERWLDFKRRIQTLSQLDPNVQKFRRMVVAGAKEAPLDAQGRILIPPHLREYAGLEKEVTVLDTGARFEIWDHGRYQQELLSTQRECQDVAKAVGDLGL